MARRIALVLLCVVLAVAIAGCAQADTGTPEGDGLHAAVPDVVGMTVPEATTALREAGYDVGSVRPDGASGKVSAQDPVAGFAAPRGTAVDLVAGR